MPILLALAVLIVALPCAAQRAVLLGPDLSTQRVTLTGLSPEGFSLVDGQGKTVNAKMDQVLRITFESARPTQPKPGHVTAALRDGQVVVGKLVGPGEGGESVVIGFGRAAGEVELSFDDLLSISLKPGVNAPKAADDDVLLLVTGEKLVGFLETIGKDAVGFVVGEADDPIQVPLDRVAGFAIANKPKPAEAKPGMLRVRLTDGSVWLLTDAVLASGKIRGDSTMAITRKQQSFAITEVVKIEPASGKYELVPLSRFEMRLVDGGEVFGVPMRPRVLPDGTIALHAPVTVGFDLPKGATRLVLSAGLVIDTTLPRERRLLAGCELFVSDGDQPTAKHTLKPDDQSKSITYDLDAGKLRITLEPGVNGPVLDRVQLRDAEVLVTR